MRKLKTILMATDFGPSSQAALQTAAGLARRFDAVLSLLHVAGDPGLPHIASLRRDLGRKLLKPIVEELQSQQVRLQETGVYSGAPSEQILNQAEELHADLIVIGTGEEMKKGHPVIGPIAQMVIERSSRPVLAVPAGEPRPAFHRILCPVDGSEVSARGLHNAVALAKTFSAELIVLAVVPEMSWLLAAGEAGTLAGAFEEHERNWQTELNAFLARQDFSGVTWTQEMPVGNPAREITRIARERKCDVLVIGATGRTGLLRVLLGSVTRRVLQDLPCSVLIVHDENLPLGRPDEADIHDINRLFSEGQALMQSKSYAAAQAKFDQVLHRNPFHAPALAARAAACDQLGDSDRAERCRRRAKLLEGELQT
jgi:universal stress protein E